MGEVAETMTKKKKKGRPSLLDLQKRALKQQQLQQQQQHRNQDDDHRSNSKNPNSDTRSKRQKPNSNGVVSDSPLIKDDGEEEDDDERREKKHKLLHGLNSHSNRHSLNPQSGGSEYTGDKNSKATGILQGSPVETGPTTPLPDKQLLVFILDRLQKKDTYGVYSDPVDPEELPDYHEIITNPMDFSTVRNKLDSGTYSSLEQFEGDIFLICANAMEYNSADTVYYRQARAIEELAKKDFENLRRDSDDDEELPNQQQQQQQQQQPKVARRGRPPKNRTEPSSIDCSASEISADALTPGGDSSNKFSGAYNLRKNPPINKFRQAETSVRMSHNSESQSVWSVDWENEFPSSVVKAVNKYGMKHFNVDDNKRDTYFNSSSSTQESSVLSSLEDELKQLIPVGLNTEYGYARSLARYAANLGPIAWKIASKRIETALPSGIKYGLGWVGENPSSGAEEDPQKQNLPSKDDHSNRILSPTASLSSPFIGNKHSSSSQAIEETEHPPSSSSSHQIKPESSNVLTRGFSHIQRQPTLTNESKPGLQQQGVLLPCIKQEFHRFPPDLNARLVSPNSPISNPSSSSQHPDLALQL